MRLYPYTGLNFKLDVGLYQLDQQVACQRIGKTKVTAERKSLIAEVKALFAPSFAPAVA